MSTSDSIDKKFELLRFNKAVYRDDLIKAFKLMESYIVQHKDTLTIVGGQAMDFSLRLKNTKLYADDAIPDYDCLSSTHVDHAYDFANLLCKEGFSDIYVHFALHISTMRVRIGWQVIMDCTYMPSVIYDKLMRLEYKGMMVIHPWYSVMDQLSALAHPFTRPPLESLMERFVKDNRRLVLLLQHYPLSTSDPILKGKRKLPPQVATLKPVKFSGLPSNYVISGWCAVAYHLDGKLGKADAKTLKFSIPENTKRSIYTTSIDDFINIKNIKYYNSIMEIARHCEYDDLEIYDASKRIITVDTANQKFVSYQFCMWEMMAWWLWRGDQHAFYGAQALLQNALDKNLEIDIVGYGDRSIEDSFILNILGFRNPTMRRMVPPNYSYGADCNVQKKFDYNDSEFFLMDGSATTRFTPALPADIDLRC